MKSAEEIMNMLEAFDLTGSLRDAGELSGSRTTPSAGTDQGSHRPRPGESH